MSPPHASELSTERVTVIRPHRGVSLEALRELWQHRELAYYLGRRDVSVRYKQTVIGALWAVLQPIALALVFAVFLTLFGGVATAGAPYALFTLCGMTIWLFITTAMSATAESTVRSAELISKVYFSRLAIPVAALLPPLVDFVAGFVVLFVALLIWGIMPTWHILLVPAVLTLALATTLGMGLWLSALVVRYRDISMVVPFLIQVLLFMTPILYPLSLIPHSYRALFSLNPFVGVLEAFRWTMLPKAEWPGWLLLPPVVTAVVLLVGGFAFFQRAQRTFADVI